MGDRRRQLAHRIQLRHSRELGAHRLLAFASAGKFDVSLLECGHGPGQRTDLVASLGVLDDDVQIALREARHAVGYLRERHDDAAPDIPGQQTSDQQADAAQNADRDPRPFGCAGDIAVRRLLLILGDLPYRRALGADGAILHAECAHEQLAPIADHLGGLFDGFLIVRELLHGLQCVCVEIRLIDPQEKSR